jgi:aminoglycoside phosphotransferase (APT) family kinase protein
MMERFEGTKPMAASHAFDVVALHAYLGKALPGYAGPLAVEQFKGGQSNPTYKLVTPGRMYVMRTKPGPVARLLPSAHAIEREFLVMRALQATDVPVPEMLLLEADESVIGRAFYVMGFVEGRVLWDPALPGASNAERAAVYDEMNRVIAALHAIDPSAVGLADFGRQGNYFERQIGRWSRQYAASALEPIPEMDRLIEWLPAHLPASARDDARASIVHGDFRLDNLLFDADAPRVRAVLDWELSTLGHPLADFSYHCMVWHIPPGVFRGLGGVDLGALGIPAEDEYIARYAARTGRAAGDLAGIAADWDFYLAYNLFRLASIMQGIAKRAADGMASSAEARTTGAKARDLARMAWASAQRAL